MSFRFRVALAAACAVLAVLASVNYAELARGDVERERNEALERYGGEVVSLVVAKDALESGQVITAADVIERDWVSDLAPEGAIVSMDYVIGRELTSPVSRNAPLTELDFRSGAQMAKVPRGCVALAVAVNDKLGITRNVAQGTELVAYEVTTEGTKLIATGITVISTPDSSQALVSGSQVTLAVVSGDAESVLAAAASGDLRLAMPADDVELERTADPQAPEPVATMSDGAKKPGSTAAGSAATAEPAANNATDDTDAAEGED